MRAQRPVTRPIWWVPTFLCFPGFWPSEGMEWIQGWRHQHPPPPIRLQKASEAPQSMPSSSGVHPQSVDPVAPPSGRQASRGDDWGLLWGCPCSAWRHASVPSWPSALHRTQSGCGRCGLLSASLSRKLTKPRRIPTVGGGGADGGRDLEVELRGRRADSARLWAVPPARDLEPRC